MPLPITRTMYMPPGFLCLPTLPTRLCTVIASGVAVTMYDRRQRIGAMGHFSHPLRIGNASTPDFAAPALVGLARMFARAGSDLQCVETYLYGGADNPEAPDFDGWRGMSNSRIGLEILDKMGVRLSGSDIGGRFARKLIFYTGTGESVLAKVEDGETEWYPPPVGETTSWTARDQWNCHV